MLFELQNPNTRLVMEKVSDQTLNEMIEKLEILKPEFKYTLCCLLELKQLRAEKKYHAENKNRDL